LQRLGINSQQHALVPTSPSIAYDYIYLGDRPVAQIDASGTHYTFDDHLSTPLAQTDSSALIAWQAEYEPFGSVWGLRAADIHQPLRLPGQVAEQMDAGANGATDRTFSVFRWYRSRWARFTQADPIGLRGGADLYEYAQDNPSVNVDRLGLSSCNSVIVFSHLFSNILLIRSDGDTLNGNSKLFNAANNNSGSRECGFKTSSDPYLFNGCGIFPPGVWHMGPFVPDDGGPDGAYGAGIWKVDDDSSAHARALTKRLVGVHCGRANHRPPGYLYWTYGCIRAENKFCTELQQCPPTWLIVVD
jgi:RHS repeat-associated protein